ncbi:MAG: hypothetical protein KGS72_04660 [Cyanobacteria bacterium REEB67]|nr:hypothetical protein [Cyanobacteria bacterium REEB67]
MGKEKSFANKQRLVKLAFTLGMLTFPSGETCLGSGEPLQEAEKQFENGQFAQCLKTLGRSTSLSARILRGRVQLIEHPGSGQEFVSAVVENRRNARALAWLGEISCRWPGQRAKSLAMANDALNFAPKNAEILSLHGRTLFETGDKSRGISEMCRAKSLDGRLFVCIDNLAQSYLENFESAKAKVEFDQLVQIFPKSPLTYAERAIFFDQCGQNAQAEADFDRALSLRPDFQLALAYKASFLFRQKRYSEVLACAATCLKGGCENALTFRARRAKIEAEKALKKTADLIDDLNHLIGQRADFRNPGFSSSQLKDYLVERAWALEKQGKFDQALKDVDLVEADKHSTSTTMLLRAKLLEDKNLWPAALRQYNKLLEGSAPVPEFLLGRARVYAKLGYRKLAEADLAAAEKMKGLKF